MADVAARVPVAVRPRAALVVHPYFITAVCIAAVGLAAAAGAYSLFLVVVFAGLVAGWSSAWSP